MPEKITVSLDPQHTLWMYPPLKIHNLLKSGSDICSLRTAWVRVMKFLAWPDVPVEN